MQEPEALDHLMGAYFHQDWDLEHEDEWMVLEAFERGEPDLAQQLPGEIDALLERLTTEEAIEHYVVRVLGGDFNARYNGGNYRAWLQQIADHIRAATN